LALVSHFTFPLQSFRAVVNIVLPLSSAAYFGSRRSVGLVKSKNGYWLRQACVRMEQLGSHWTDFRQISYVGISLKPVKKIQVLLQSEKNNR
jgi:hypothetical protein